MIGKPKFVSARVIRSDRRLPALAETKRLGSLTFANVGFRLNFGPMNLKSGFVRVLAILAFALAICSSSQAAQPSSAGNGRLVVQRSPAFGSKEFLRLSIDGKVHDIAPGTRYDQPISAGHHVLIADAPRSQRQPISMSLTVDPGHTYAFTATRETDQGVSLKRSGRMP